MFVYLMLIPVFLFALDPKPTPNSKEKQNTKRDKKKIAKEIAVKTPDQLKEEAKKHKKPLSKPIDELLACLKLFEMNGNRDINELYTEFLTSNPGSDMIDFSQYLYQTGIALSSRSTDSTEKVQLYQVIMITSTDKKALEGVQEYSSEESISRYCIAYGLTRALKRMSKESVLIKFGNTQLKKFSKIYYANGLYRIYYLFDFAFEPADFFEKLNQGTLTFAKNVTLLARSKRF